MAVRASRKILKGEQIFNSYTKFLWGTQQRRVHLAYSKNFLCKCERCVDPTEFGSFISALKCVRPDCDNVMLPVDPLIVTSPWECTNCHLKLDHARISKICDIVSKQIFNKILHEPMSVINSYLKTKLSAILPDSNQFTIEVKLQIILKMRRDPNYSMTLEDYEDVEKYCTDVLSTIERLKCGECFVKGLLYHSLLATKVKLAELKGQVFDDVSRTSKKVRCIFSLPSRFSFSFIAASIYYNAKVPDDNQTQRFIQLLKHFIEQCKLLPLQVCQIFFHLTFNA